MKRVLILENNEDIRTIVATKTAKAFRAEVVAGPLSQALSELSKLEFSLVISDVQDDENEGFWLHRFLEKNCPRTKMILFVSDDRMLRNIPQIDSIILATVLKFNFERLVREIEKTNILDVCLAAQGNGKGERKC